VHRKIWIGTAFIGAAVLVGPAFADLSGDLKQCVVVKDASKRLACFDVLAEKANLEGSSGATRQKSGWSLASSVSPLTDKSEVFLQKSSEKPVETDAFGIARPIFRIQCLNGKTSVAVDWGFIIDGGIIPVTYRIDADEPKTVAINVSDDFRSIASWDSARAIAFLKTLIGKKQLAIQVTALSQGPVRAVFDMTGLEKAVLPLRKACSW
jgi:type VI secretion system protein VasI